MALNEKMMITTSFVLVCCHSIISDLLHKRDKYIIAYKLMCVCVCVFTVLLGLDFNGSGPACFPL